MTPKDPDGRRAKRLGLLRDRGRTERALSDSVRSLVNREGILGDFSISEIAQEAGVDRALVYRYFGNRRGLLRVALRSGVSERLTRFEALLEDVPMSPDERFRRYLRFLIDEESSLAVVATLLIDRDPEVEAMMSERTLPLVLADQDAGAVIDSLNVRAFLAAITSMGYGYALFRRSFADALDVPLEVLDQDVEEIFHAWLRSLRGRRTRRLRDR